MTAEKLHQSQWELFFQYLNDFEFQRWLISILRLIESQRKNIKSLLNEFNIQMRLTYVFLKTQLFAWNVVSSQ